MPAKNDIIQDPNTVGKHYVGVNNVDLLGVSSRPFRYGFVLWTDISTSLFAPNNKQVILPFPPNTIVVDEPFATNIVYAQGAGKFVERKGQISKIISLSGTTGFNYAPKLPTSVRMVTPQSTIVEVEGPTSGMGRFLELRGLFREYANIFSDDSLQEKRAKTAFVFVNEKDDENWIVEPISFKMTRSAPRDKFVYRYDITLQTIAPAESGQFIEDDWVTLYRIARNVRQVVSNVSHLISQYSASIGNLAAATTGAISEASGSLFNVMTSIASGLSLIADGTRSVMSLPNLIKGQADTALNSFQSTYENWLAVGDKIELESGPGSFPYSFDELRDATNAASAIGGLAGRSELFNNSLSTAWKNTLTNYQANFGFGGFNQSLIEPLNKYGVREVEILPRDDLIRIAIRELGSAERFMELVVLNNLKPPYVSTDKSYRLPNTLAPGDPILLPVQGSTNAPKAPTKTTVYTDPTLTSEVLSHSGLTTTLDTAGKTFRDNQWAGFKAKIVLGTGAGQSRNVESNDADSIVADATWFPNPAADSVIKLYLVRAGVTPTKSANEQILGVDLKFTATFDIEVTQHGDAATVSGSTNMLQAIDAKFRTKPGELPAHVSYGLGFSSGQRATADSVLTYRLAVRQMLLSDRRITDVQQVRISVNGDRLDFQAYVITSGNAQPFSIDTRGL